VPLINKETNVSINRSQNRNKSNVDDLANGQKEDLIPHVIVRRKKINSFSTNSKHWSVTKRFIKVKEI
jgi:hypothetical protein